MTSWSMTAKRLPPYEGLPNLTGVKAEVVAFLASSKASFVTGPGYPTEVGAWPFSRGP